jgi:hypothetical protein
VIVSQAWVVEYSYFGHTFTAYVSGSSGEIFGLHESTSLGNGIRFVKSLWRCVLADSYTVVYAGLLLKVFVEVCRLFLTTVVYADLLLTRMSSKEMISFWELCCFVASYHNCG